MLLNVAKDQTVALKFVGANLPRPDISRIARHFWYMNDLLLHYIDLVVPPIEECAIGCGNLLLNHGLRRVGQLLPIRVDDDGTHVAVALVHEKSLCMWTEGRKWLRGPIVHSLLSRNQLPCPNNPITNV